MLKRNDKTMTNSNIEFVSYTGASPLLCFGVLTVKVNGKEYKFGTHGHSLLNEDDDYYPEMLPKFWTSGGYCRLNENLEEEVETGPWEMIHSLNEYAYPKEIWECLNDILDVFNNNVPWGCCGGCL